LALAESERALPGLMDQIDEILRGLQLDGEPILIRMTGCPNGCSRPYNADISFVGRGPDRYALYAGGSVRGDRLASLYKHTVTTEEIPDTVRKMLVEFKNNRSNGELFTDYWARSHPNGEAPHPEQFHYELEARDAARAGTPPE
jgi:sulfite reductase beta subunit-like hemoprotein